MNRRRFLRTTTAGVAGVGVGTMLPRVLWGQQSGEAMPPSGHLQMARFPEKTDLILLTDRPPQLETPIRYFRQDLTPNDAFFVRWHLSAIPTSVDLGTFRLGIAGHIDRPMNLSLGQLKNDFE